MKANIIIIIFFVVCLSISAKNHYFQELIHPAVWYHPDTAIISPSFCDTISAPTHYTMMMVYKTLQPDTIQQLWKISRQDSVFYAISTHGLFTETIPLFRNNRQISLYIRPCIYTTQHSMELDTTRNDIYQLCIGADTPTDSTQIVLYEMAYFPTNLSRKQSLIFQTYLALKHGITLRHAHYLSTMGDTIWNAKTDKQYYHHVQGIVSDSVYNYYSLTSTSMEDDILRISCSDTLPYNSYAILGDDNAELEWYAYENTTAMLQRTWKLKTTNNLQSLIICLNQDKIEEMTDTLHLVLLNTEDEIIRTIIPDSIDTDNNIYYTIVPYEKQLYFSFISTMKMSNDNRKISKKYNTQNPMEQSEDDTLINDMKVTLGPNPTNSRYSLNISLSQPTYILFVIQDPSGKVVMRKVLTDSSVYQYSGCLYSKGLYLFSFYSNDGRLLSTQELLVY